MATFACRVHPTGARACKWGTQHMQLITRRRSGPEVPAPVGCQRLPREAGQPGRRLCLALPWMDSFALSCFNLADLVSLAALASQTLSQAGSQ